MPDNPKDFVVYSVGLVYCSVCTSLVIEEATRRLNIEMPAGTKDGWGKADKNFRDGTSNPCPCDTHPETHKHYLFEC